jgi:hypothetical protein
MAALNVIDPTTYYCAAYGHHLEEQQLLFSLPVQQQYIPTFTGFEQPIGPISIMPCDIANSYPSYVNVAHPLQTFSHQQLPTFPNPSILW